MKNVCVTWDRYKDYFPPLFECATSSPEYLLLMKRRGRRRKRGSRSGVQYRQRKQGGQTSWFNGSRSVGAERCLRLVPVSDRTWESNRAPPASASPRLSDRIFPIRLGRILAPREHVLRAITIDNALAMPRCPAGQRTLPVHSARQTRFALLNARSISNKALYLGDLFTNGNLDFMALTETWQREQEYYHLNELCPPDCSVLGTPRVARRGGGLALIHRNCFRCRLTKSEPFNSFELQMTKVGNTDFFYCILIYRPPGPARKFLDEFSDFLSAIIKLDKVLIIGDFNFHIDDPFCNAASEFLTLTDSFNLKQHVSGPTHKKGHTLDLVFSFGLDINCLNVVDIHVTDHCCIYFNVSCNMVSDAHTVVSKRRIINQKVIENFSDFFQPKFFEDYSDAEPLVNHFNDHCLSDLDIVAPVKHKTTSPKNPCPWLNEEIASSRRICRKVERLWKSTNLEVHRLPLKELIVSLNEMMKQARSKYFFNLVNQNKRNPKVVSDTIQNIVSPSTPLVSVFTIEDCNNFLKYFVNKVNEIKSSVKAPDESPIVVATLNCSWANFSVVSLDDVMILLKKMKPSSCALDILPTSMFVKVIDLVGPIVVKIINISLSTGIVPNFYKQAVISPI